ncbi:uncharacterized protein TNCV_618291 [Trichonephila clavipes]|nr:uncharacterized protein TNCV_618291 [Trichonephila clavipes]
MPRRDGPYIVLSQRSPTTFVVASCDKPDEPLGVYHTSALTPFLNGTETQSPVVPLKKRGRPRKQPLVPRGTAGENAIMSASTPPLRDGLRRSKAFEIPLSSLSTILKNKENIFSASSSRVRKRVSKGKFPRLEQCLVSWMRQCRGHNIPMGGFLLKEKAKAFAKELEIEFSASEGWLTNFKKRNGIVFKKNVRGKLKCRH